MDSFADMPPEQFRKEAARVAEWVASYRERVADLPVRARVLPGEIATQLPEAAPAESEPIADILRDLDEIILPGLTHWNHPGFLAYFASSSSAPGVLAEFVIAALGINAMLWRTSPAATELEERMVQWLRGAVGLPEDFQGVILDTASTSSFTALLAAREAAIPEVRQRGLAGRSDLGHPTIYVSEQAHSSLSKAAMAAGLGLRSVRHIPTDRSYRMEVAALETSIRKDRETGDHPFMVCATLGTTGTGSVDPVARIAEVTRREGLWLHVDAAYAGPAAMLPELRPGFEGWERADSIVLNPHKWMGTPMDCSVLLFRSPDAFRASLALTPAYLRSEVEGVTELMDFGLPLGRRFRALKLWFLFRSFGTDGLRRMFREHIEMARKFAEKIETSETFELAAPVSFSTVCFRGTSPTGGERVDRELLEAVNEEGRVFLSSTELEGRFTLRLSVGSVHTRAEDLEAAYESLVRAHGALSRRP